MCPFRGLGGDGLDGDGQVGDGLGDDGQGGDRLGGMDWVVMEGVPHGLAAPRSLAKPGSPRRAARSRPWAPAALSRAPAALHTASGSGGGRRGTTGTGSRGRAAPPGARPPGLPGWRPAWAGESRVGPEQDRGARTPNCAVEGHASPTLGILGRSQLVRLKPQDTASAAIWDPWGPFVTGHDGDPHPFSVCQLGTTSSPSVHPPPPPAPPDFQEGPAEPALVVTQSSPAHLAEPSSTRRCVTALPSHQSWEQKEAEAKGSPRPKWRLAAPCLISDPFPLRFLCHQASLAWEFIFPTFPSKARQGKPRHGLWAPCHEGTTGKISWGHPEGEVLEPV
ncbi:uncharacterized protein ACIBXB_018631 [Morphnus guianensis]